MKQSLNGLRVLNTRPHDQAQKLGQSIRAAGGQNIECPALEIQPTANCWVNALPDLQQIRHAIFVSQNAVHYCFNQLRQSHINWPATINVIAIGQGTAKALAEFNVHVNEFPQLPDSEHLLALNSLQNIKNQTVLLFKGEGGRALIENHLALHQAKVHSLLVYKRVMPQVNEPFIRSIWHNDLVDIILYTSEQSIRNIFKMFGNDGLQWLQDKPCMVISERLAKVAAQHGINKIIVSHPDRIINTLFEFKD